MSDEVDEVTRLVQTSLYDEGEEKIAFGLVDEYYAHADQANWSLIKIFDRRGFSQADADLIHAAVRTGDDAPGAVELLVALARWTRPIVESLLDDPFPPARARGVAAIARLDGAARVLRFLEDPGPDVRKAVVRALADACYRDPQLLAHLLQALSDPDPDVRCTVIWRLAREWQRDARLLVHLEAALDHEFADVRREAAVAFQYVAGVGGGDALVRRFGVETDGGVREALLAAILVKAGDDLTPVRAVLLDELNSSDPARRKAVAILIRRRFEDAEAAGAMLDRLRIEDVPAIRSHLVGCKGYPAIAGRALPVLSSLLASDADPVTRVAVAWRLGDFGPAATPVLLDALDDPDHRVRAAAATSLGAVGDADVLAKLRAVAQDPDPGYDVTRGNGTSGKLRGEIWSAVHALAARCEPPAKTPRRRPGSRPGRGNPR
jgi:HEAT repeat protein